MKILIADDDLTSRLVLATTLQGMGHTVVAVENGRLAWERWQSEAFALLISDWQMPDLDGLALCQQIRSTEREHYTCVILLTSKEGKGSQLDGMAAGADDFITKPFDEKLLAARLCVAERMLALHDALRTETAAVVERNAHLEALNQKLAAAQSQLMQSEKMASVGLLAAGVAHEINNPIAFVHANFATLKDYLGEFFQVLGAYEELERALPNEHPALLPIRAFKQSSDLAFLQQDTSALLAETLEGVLRIKKIVQDLKDFSHPDEPEWQRVDLHRCLDSTLNIVAPELKYKVQLVKRYGTLPNIYCLPFQLNQVFMNLLINAAQAIAVNGTITITTGVDGPMAWVTIRDTGAGIAAEHINRVFDPFFTTKPIGIGTGLGLSVSYGIVQRHGGTIVVDSVVGDGTAFTVRLPMDGGPAVRSNPT